MDCRIKSGKEDPPDDGSDRDHGPSVESGPRIMRPVSAVPLEELTAPEGDRARPKASGKGSGAAVEAAFKSAKPEPGLPSEGSQFTKI